MKNFLALALLAVLATPSLAVRRECETPAEGSGPTAAMLERCNAQDLADFVVAAVTAPMRLGAKACLTSRVAVMSYRLEDLSLVLTCTQREREVWTFNIFDEKLRKADLAILPVGISAEDGPSLIRISELPPSAKLRALTGAPLVEAFRKAAVPASTINYAVTVFRDGLRREIQAESLEEFLKKTPKF